MRILLIIGLLLPIFGAGIAFFAQSHGARAATGINEQVNYQARLLTSSGATVPDGTYNIRFKIYQDGTGCESGGNSPCGGTLKWTEARESTNRVTVKNGYFSVALGSVTPFSGQVDWNQDSLWLSIDIGGTGTTASYDGEMTPFRRLAAVPYALNAKQLGGLDASRFVQVAPSAVQGDASTLDTVFLNKTGASGNILRLQKNGTDVATVGNTGAVTFRNSADSAGAFNVNNQAGNSVLTVDTSGGQVLLGTSGSVTGKVTFDNATNTNLASIQSGVTTSSYTLTLPTAVGATGDCLKASNNTGALTFGTCGGAGSTTLQNAYDNSGSPATITTSSIAKGVLIKSGSGFNGASAFEVQDAGGVPDFSVNTATGISTANSLATQTIDSPSGTGTAPAITRTARTNASTPSSTSYGTGAYTPSGTFTPAANSVLVANISAGENCTGNTFAADGSDITISGGSLTWIPIGGAARVSSNTPCDVGIRSFYAVVGSTPPSNMQITADAGAFDVFAYTTYVQEYGNVNTSSPIAGFSAAQRSSTNNETFAGTLAAAPTTGDQKVGFVSMQNQDPGTAGSSGYNTPSGWTNLAVTTTAPTNGPSAQLNTQTGVTTTAVNFSTATLRSPPNDTVYMGYTVKQAPASGTGGDINIGGTLAPNTNIGNGTLTINRSGGIVQVGSVTADATAVEFVLDKYNVAGDPTAIDGAMYYNSSSRSFRCAMNGRWRSCVSGVVVANTTANTAVSNSTAETNFATTYSIPANDCQPGRVFRVTAQGILSHVGTTPPSLNVQMKLGSTVLASTGSLALGTVAATNREWRLEGQFICQTTGTSGTIEPGGTFTRFTAANAGGTTNNAVTWEMLAATPTAAVTVDTTAAQTLSISAQWSSASTSNSIQARQIIVEESGP